MRITNVEIVQVSGVWREEDYKPKGRQVQPIDIYPDLDQFELRTFTSDPQEIRALYVEVQSDEGVSGLFGPVQRSQAFIVAHELRPFLIGRDPLATELLLDQMMRLNRHGRSGMFMTGVSAVDCALWDLKGKAWDKPVYRLLGGPTRPAVPAYASTLGYSSEPEDAAKTAQTLKEKGYQAQKWFFAYGPGRGMEGLEKNIAMAQAVRTAVGPHYMLMFDAFMSWTVQYAVKMVQALEPMNPTWVEEPVPPERVGELRKLRQASRVPIATGEHVFTRWQTKELLVNEAVDWLQNDPDWTGGVTELMKICTLASSFDVPLVSHGHSLLPALHIAGAQSPTTVPMVEYLLAYQPIKQFFHRPCYEPEHGSVALPDLPGLGLVLDDDKVVSREAVRF